MIHNKNLKGYNMAKAKIRITVKSIITNGLINGWTMARILKTVATKVPGSVANEKHVRVYASSMHKEGDITLERKNKYLVRPKKASPAKPKAVVKKKAAKKKAVKKK